MTNVSDSAAATAALRREIRRLKVICFLSMFSMICFVLSFRTVQAQSDNRILRVRGIIIEDAAGHERILIGAPIPAAQNRVRTDEARVREVWAKRLIPGNPDRYMNFYKTYKHDTNGILILDEQGFDRLALGDQTPDPNIGKRNAPSTGMVINDEQGFERAGFGLHNVNGQHRVVLGMDSNEGREALSLAVRDEGGIGITINDRQQQQSLYAGTAPANRRITGTEEPFSGFMVKDANAMKSITTNPK